MNSSFRQTDWYWVEIRRDPEKDRVDRLSRLMELVEKEVPSIDDRPDRWRAFAQTWAQLKTLPNQVGRPLDVNVASRLRLLQTHLD